MLDENHCLNLPFMKVYFCSIFPYCLLVIICIAEHSSFIVISEAHADLSLNKLLSLGLLLITII